MAEIKVKITDESGETTIGSVSTTSGAKLTTNTPEVRQNKKNSLAIAAGTTAIQQTIQYTTSNIGKWTGNSRNQTTINNITQAGTIGLVALSNPYAAAAMVAMQLGTTAIDYHFERVWNDRQERNSLARAGYSSRGELLGRKR